MRMGGQVERYWHRNEDSIFGLTRVFINFANISFLIQNIFLENDNEKISKKKCNK